MTDVNAKTYGPSNKMTDEGRRMVFDGRMGTGLMGDGRRMTDDGP